MLSGETLYNVANPECADCKAALTPKVCRSFAGYYVGTWCDCGPYSRESGYFPTEAEARWALEFMNEASVAGVPVPPSGPEANKSEAVLDMARESGLEVAAVSLSPTPEDLSGIPR